MHAAARQDVRERARNRCEYCQLSQETTGLRHHIEHIVARKHGGANVMENLALACHRCNLHKGSNLSGIDPDTGEIVALFHPRRDRWSDHFRWRGVRVEGITPQGRATVQVLRMNHARRLELRSHLQAL
jgi:5-methylcytosine-specific restriction endonuclease McrA